MLESFKRRLQHRFFPVNIAKFLRTPISIEHYPMVAFEVSFYRVVSGNSYNTWTILSRDTVIFVLAAIVELNK